MRCTFKCACPPGSSPGPGPLDVELDDDGEPPPPSKEVGNFSPALPPIPPYSAGLTGGHSDAHRFTRQKSATYRDLGNLLQRKASPRPPHRLMRGTLRRLNAEKPRSSCSKHQPQLGFLDRANSWGWLHPWRGLPPWTRRSGSMFFEPQVVAKCPRREVRILC